MSDTMYVLEDGTETPDKEKNYCAQMVITDSDRHIFYVKASHGGAELFNPSKVNDIGYRKRLWKMRPVKKEIFSLYVRFLGLFNKQEKGREGIIRSAERLLS